MLDQHNDDYQTLGMRYCISQEGIELLINALRDLKKVLPQIALQEGERKIEEPPRTLSKGM